MKDDTISRQAAIDAIEKTKAAMATDGEIYVAKINAEMNIQQLPSVSTEKTGHCKDCKYFEYDSVAKVDGIPLIVAHEICSKWGDGCKTREDGYCFLFEPQPYKGESEE